MLIKPEHVIGLNNDNDIEIAMTEAVKKAFYKALILWFPPVRINSQYHMNLIEEEFQKYYGGSGYILIYEVAYQEFIQCYVDNGNLKWEMSRYVNYLSDDIRNSVVELTKEYLKQRGVQIGSNKQ